MAARKAISAAWLQAVAYLPACNFGAGDSVQLGLTRRVRRFVVTLFLSILSQEIILAGQPTVARECPKRLGQPS